MFLNLVVHLGVFELGCAFARLAQKACLKMGCKSPRRSAGVLSGFSLKKRNLGVFELGCVRRGANLFFLDDLIV